jgi:hypothetical protein
MISTIMKGGRAISRVTCLLVYGLSLFIAHQVQPIVAKAYDDLCAVQGVTYGNGNSERELLSIFAILSAVTLFARSTTLIIANLIISSLTFLGAVGLLFTAGSTLYECFTTMGTYEDHTSVRIAAQLRTTFTAHISFKLVNWRSSWTPNNVECYRLACIAP